MGKQRYNPFFVGTNHYNAAREREDNFIGKKIAEARRKQGLSLAAFSTLLKPYGIIIGRQGLGKWESGDAIPNGYQLLAVCHALNIENGLDYFTGHPKKEEPLNDLGLKKLHDYREDLIASGRYTAAPEVLYIDMPVSLLPASAGTGAFLEEENFELRSVPADSVPSGADFGVRISGDSMEPVYRDGQIVWVQRCSKLNPGQVGLFLYDGDGYIKVYDEQEPDMPEASVDFEGSLQKQPVLISYNKKYPPKAVSPELSFLIAGRILS